MAWPAYNWMGVAKSALQSVSRYLAKELGPKRHPLQPRRRRSGAHDGRQVHPGLRPVRGHLGRPCAARLGRHRLRAGRQGVRGAAVATGSPPRPARSSTSTAGITRWAPNVPAVNRLADETSPYLRQHRDNPVDWYPWGAEAFAAAASRDVPILLSVGYSACHWCHVMAHESFEDDDVGGGDERAVRQRQGRPRGATRRRRHLHGRRAGDDRARRLADDGVPDPDGRPFYGGTYFPRAAAVPAADRARIDDVWRNRRDDIEQNADALVEALLGRSADDRARRRRARPRDARTPRCSSWPSSSTTNGAASARAPKFPSTMSLELVLRAHCAPAPTSARDVVTTSLDAMAVGRHVRPPRRRVRPLLRRPRSGWCRTSRRCSTTRRCWCACTCTLAGLRRPTAAARSSTRPSATCCATCATRTAGSTRREDADSPDARRPRPRGPVLHVDARRGARRCSTLPDGRDAVLEWYGVTDAGNFEGRIDPQPPRAPRRAASGPPTIEQRAGSDCSTARERAPRPGLDDKVLTEWNALMLSSLAEAGGRVRTRRLARRRRRQRRVPARASSATTDGRWLRSWQADGIAAGTPLARSPPTTPRSSTRSPASARPPARRAGSTRRMQSPTRCSTGSGTPSSGGLFTTADDGEALVVRQKDLLDNATPSANSIAAVGLLRLAALTGERALRATTPTASCNCSARSPAQYPGAASTPSLAMETRAAGMAEFAVVGDRADLVHVAQSAVAPRWSCWRGASRTSRRCGRAAATASRTCAATSRARRPCRSPDALYEQITGQQPPRRPATARMICSGGRPGRPALEP